ncbi:MAG: TOBE domain-containing protein [Desulfosoma sp.]|uniref:TOBE domain-containing protein n=1 Tax=Desulfosoma sp. TaxID=2603217 RepID=UPI00404AFC9C
MVAEVKAPWVVLAVGSEQPLMSLENRFQGTIRRIVRGQVTAEVTVELADGTALCAIVSTESAQRLSFKEGDVAWAGFSAHAVVLHGHADQPSLWSSIPPGA